MKKIDWKRLKNAMFETLMIMLCGLIMTCLFALPLVLAIKTGHMLWFALYAVVYFIGETWEKYHDR